MLLSRLVRALPTCGPMLVATSNYPPQGLLPDPRHHALVLPLITALQHCDVLELPDRWTTARSGTAGRGPAGSAAPGPPGSACQRTALGRQVSDAVDRVRLTVGGRPLWAPAEDDRRVQFDFAEMCAGTTSVGDLLELADRYRTLMLAGVPPLATEPAGVRPRFGDLVDVLWDRDVRLFVIASGLAAHILDADPTDAERMRSRVLLFQLLTRDASTSQEPFGRRDRGPSPCSARKQR